MPRIIAYAIQIFFWSSLVFAAIHFRNDILNLDRWHIIKTKIGSTEIVVLSMCIIFAMVLRGIRWGRLQKDFFKIPAQLAIITYGWSFIPTAFTPFRLGEACRALWVTNQGGSLSEATGVILSERVLDLLVLCLLLFISFLFYPSVSNELEGKAIPGIVFLVVFAYLLFFTGFLRWMFHQINNLSIIRNKQQKRESIGKILSKLKSFIWAVSGIRENRGLLPAFLSTFTIWLSMAICFHHFLQLFFPDAPVAVAINVLVFVNISSLLALAPGNFGIFEMATVLALKGYGIDISQSIVPAIFLHFVVLVVPTVYGLLCKAISIFAQNKTS